MAIGFEEGKDKRSLLNDCLIDEEGELISVL
jgi:hypothetical protein